APSDRGPNASTEEPAASTEPASEAEPDTPPTPAEAEATDDPPPEPPVPPTSPTEDSAAAPRPEPPPETTTLSPAIAQGTVSSFYNQVSNQAWEAARDSISGPLAQQFDPGFFEQFQRVSVDNLRVTQQTANGIELLGENTYIYPDGSTQREARTFTVELVEGQPRIVGSQFVRVIQAR
ncbi:MAG: hypothetical protein AAF728_19840, partial [Cyanobacteria bacterium P01_D01_bin.128]